MSADRPLFSSWDSFHSKVQALSQAMAARQGEPVRLAKKTSNLFRTRTPANAGRLNVRSLDQTIAIDPETGIADVEGMTTFERFADAALSRGFVPPVIPELKTITVGGAVSGIGIEASSFRHGLVHETVTEMDILLADGSVVTCSREEHADLFRAIPNSYGTLGYILRVRIPLLRAKPFVELSHTRLHSKDRLLEALDKASSPDSPHHFVEAVAFAPNDFVLTTATLTDATGPVSDYKGMEIYYQSLRSRTSDRLVVRDFLWRWDTDWFWCSRNFGMANPTLRRLLGRWMLSSASYWKILSHYRSWNVESKMHALRKALGLPIELREPVIQDVEIPVEHCSEFLDFYFREVDIRPCWICPIRPLADGDQWTLYSMQPGKLHLNFGFWESVITDTSKEPGYCNRRIENIVQSLGGRKSLYSTSFYPEDEFWKIYNGDAYSELKAKYDPRSRFRSLYEKTVRGR